ncbi:hypothetical protein LEP1GSC043_0021 [Leptospira weilii str. Ecochallenge]|uniref:Uncharacterized protein n=1 Tax=Leptospira weilii str. Ecochallenge TaxID=1049986 RepID=N1UC20_9LEPT|nr:hypothetical protein LEP1GSC043_0021 [Leptospira weilii str. Ecochallenge]
MSNPERSEETKLGDGRNRSFIYFFADNKSIIYKLLKHIYR